MNHLSQEDIVAAYYREHDRSAVEHLHDCAECRAELARVAEVLDRVAAPEVPEPPLDYEVRVWQRLRWRMRSEARKEKRSEWMKWIAVAAVVAVAFVTGLLWKRNNQPVSMQATNTTSTAQPANQTASTTAQQGRDRVLLVVVSDHFDRSERILVELTNLTPNDDNIDIGAERALAEELLASNRLYRRTALDRGEESVATLLDELEPVLMQIAHTPEDVSADELRRIQKRVEAKGLVFKLRVLRQDVQTSTPNQQPNV